MAAPVPAVLLIAWRRPDTTRQVLEALRIARPARLFVAVDGPDDEARPGEQDAVAATIATIEAGVDWPCDLRRRYSSENLGCRRGVRSAIDWFFSEVEEGIILEDDCVPGTEFFDYCAELLERYRQDPRVLCISGTNVADVRPTRGRSYGYVRYPQIWGWATWRRAWDLYDRDLDRYAAARGDGSWERAVPDPFQREVFSRILDRLRTTGEPDTWDYQWAATVLLEGGLSIHPMANLVRNVGFGDGATHTTEAGHAFADVAATSILPLRHPRRIRLDRRLDRRLFLKTQVSENARRKYTRRRLRRMIVGSRLLDRIWRGIARRSKLGRRRRG